jgi:anti-sigma regulatory factor (Ser/Thr protein kinase)
VHLLDVRLPARSRAVPTARHAVEALNGVVSEDALEDTRLLVSELVTNSVRHAGLGPSQPIVLRAELRGESLHVEVSDDGRGFDRPDTSPTPGDNSGWGLFLVAQLADRWGIDDARPTTVWFEVPAKARSAGSGRI